MSNGKQIICPRCGGVKVVKNGKKANGQQNLLCRDCRLQFQPSYTYPGADKGTKKLMVRMMLRGSGVRDCAAVLEVSRDTVLRTLLSEGKDLRIVPACTRYERLQIDEQWSFVGKKAKRVWMIYAVCAHSGEIVAASWGKRNKKNVRMLLVKLKGIGVGAYCTDEWVSFAEVLPKEKHLVGKQFTKKIEGINTWFRTRLRRLVRRTTCFSKKLLYHYAIIKLAIVSRNNQLSYI